MTPNERVLVIIPTYNEAENIETICARTREALRGAEILIVDDNSPDGTGQIADRLAGADAKIHVMHREAKNGLGAAYLAGFRWGLEEGAEILVEMDADGSHRPEELPGLVGALAEADMAKGSRYVPGGKVVNWPKSREFLSRVGNLWIRALLGIPVRDITGGFNAFRASTLEAIIDDVTSQGYNFQADLTWQVHSRGMKVVETPITFAQRELGQSKMSGGIVLEALAKTTAWGLRYRVRQAGRWITRVFRA